MATPHVSGVAALVKSVNPTLTAVQIKNIILSSVDAKGPLSGLVLTGGRLDAYRAVASTPPAPPVANFTGMPTTGASPLTVNFVDNSRNTPTAWLWIFGDGNIENATMQNPQHTYQVAGTYTVSLTASNGGGSATMAKIGYINVTNQTDTIGVYRNGAFYLRNTPTTTVTIVYGLPTDTPLIGDWSGSGTDTAGVWRSGVFYLRNNQTVTTAVVYGLPTDTPLIGDWTGAGTDTVGVWRSGVFYLRNNQTTTTSVVYGLPTDTPLVWKDNGTSKVGIFRSGVFYLRKDATTTTTIVYGLPIDTPLIGDWTGSGTDTAGVWRSGVFYLRNSPTITSSTTFGLSSDTPLAGKWG